MQGKRPPDTLAAGLFLGVASGGFFDGILLHQVLQWHHLLSSFSDELPLASQVLADGLFHVLMYLLAGVGLAKLYRNRAAFAGAAGGRLLLGGLLMGFGGWHVADAVLSHWVLGLHRLREDVDQPLPWELAWLLLFGLLPLAAGARLRREVTLSLQGRSLPLVVALAVTTAGWAAARPDPATPVGRLAVVLRPDVSPGAFLAGLPGPARVLQASADGRAWLVDGADTLALYRGGALLVSGSVLPAGCSGWMRMRAGL